MLVKWRRKVRLYVKDGPTIEGVLAGRTFRHRDYILWSPKIVEGEPAPSVEVTGHVEVDAKNVLWVQVL